MTSIPSRAGTRPAPTKRASGSVEWEHVTPASWFGAYRPCWKGHERCVRMSGKDKGESYGKRECCYKQGVDPEFRAAFVDPHNLFPADGEVNNDPRQPCVWERTGRTSPLRGLRLRGRWSSPKVAEPDKCVRGELARAMLYMEDQHGARLEMERDVLLAWHEADPPEDWERRRAHRIEAATGLRNLYIGPP